MSRESDEKFASEVEKRLQNLFDDSAEGKLEDFLTEEGEGIISSQEESIEDISADDLLEDQSIDDALDEIVPEDLLNEDAYEEVLEGDVLEEGSLDDVLEGDVLEDMSEEDYPGDVLDGDAIETVLNEESIEEVMSGDPSENVLEDDSLEEVLNEDTREGVLNEESIEDVLNDDSYEDALNDELSDGPPGDSVYELEDIKYENVSIKESGDYKFYPFRLLKAIVLSIDWEITEDVMDRFIGQVTRLMETYRNDKNVLVYLHLLWELGKYIRKHRGKSHPNSINVLSSVFNSLEKTVSDPSLSESDKKEILFSQMNKVKKLKKQMALHRPDAAKKIPTDDAIVGEKGDIMIGQTNVSEEMVAAIRTVVKAEVKAFLKDLGGWLDNR